MANLEKLLHLRFWFACVVVALIPTTLLAWLWEPLGWTFWLFFPATVALALAFGTANYQCPYCRKNLKAGATVCHHCGRAVPERNPNLVTDGGA